MKKKTKPADVPELYAYRVDLYEVGPDTMIFVRFVGVAANAREAMHEAERLANEERTRGLGKRAREQSTPLEARSAELLGRVKFGPVHPAYRAAAEDDDV